MEIVVLLVAAYLVVTGALLALVPPAGEKLAYWALQDKRSRLAAGLTMLLGAVLIAASPYCRIPALVGLWGLIVLVKGIILLFAPKDKVLGVWEAWQRAPRSIRRVWGLGALSFGVILLAAC